MTAPLQPLPRPFTFEIVLTLQLKSLQRNALFATTGNYTSCVRKDEQMQQIVTLLASNLAATGVNRTKPWNQPWYSRKADLLRHQEAPQAMVAPPTQDHLRLRRPHAMPEGSTIRSARTHLPVPVLTVAGCNISSTHLVTTTATGTTLRVLTVCYAVHGLRIVRHDSV